MIRYDSAYAANAIRGNTRANENKDMIFEIRRHYQCLLERLKELNIRFGWSHVPAHSSFRWNDQVDALSKDAAQGKVVSTWSVFRNLRPGYSVDGASVLDTHLTGDVNYESQHPSVQPTPRN